VVAVDYSSHIHRLFRLITLIQGQPNLGPPQLAELLDRTERTIFRDLAILKEAGVPIDINPETGGYIIRKDFFLRPVDLTLEEALALLLLAEQVGGHQQLPHLQEAGKAAEKLRTILPRQFGDMIDEILPRTTVSLARRSNEPTADVYDAVRNAISEKRALECAYGSPRGDPTAAETRFRFDPYAIYYGQRAFYVIGKHHGHGDIRTLKLSRFNCCRRTDTPYMIPEDFSLASHFGKAWRMMPHGQLYKIRLQFSAKVAETTADTHWHDSQQEEDGPDGSTILSFEVDGLEEIIYWILSYGEHCRVLEPPELAERVSEMHRKAAEQYSR